MQNLLLLSKSEQIYWRTREDNSESAEISGKVAARPVFLCLSFSLFKSLFRSLCGRERGFRIHAFFNKNQ